MVKKGQYDTVNLAQAILEQIRSEFDSGQDPENSALALHELVYKAPEVVSTNLFIEVRQMYGYARNHGLNIGAEIFHEILFGLMERHPGLCDAPTILHALRFKERVMNGDPIARSYEFGDDTPRLNATIFAAVALCRDPELRIATQKGDKLMYKLRAAEHIPSVASDRISQAMGLGIIPATVLSADKFNNKMTDLRDTLRAIPSNGKPGFYQKAREARGALTYIDHCFRIHPESAVDGRMRRIERLHKIEMDYRGRPDMDPDLLGEIVDVGLGAIERNLYHVSPAALAHLCGHYVSSHAETAKDNGAFKRNPERVSHTAEAAILLNGGNSKMLSSIFIHECKKILVLQGEIDSGQTQPSEVTQKILIARFALMGMVLATGARLVDDRGIDVSGIYGQTNGLLFAWNSFNRQLANDMGIAPEHLAHAKKFIQAPGASSGTASQGTPTTRQDPIRSR